MTTETPTDIEFSSATPAEIPFIRETAERLILDANDLSAEQFITVREDGRIVAFGRVRPYKETFELATLAVVEEHRGKGLGEAVARELIRRFPQDEVYVVTDLIGYWERLGFIRTEILPPELEEKRQTACSTLRPGAEGMVYDRRIEKLPGIADVYRAKHVLEGQLPRTPLLWNPHISRDLGCDLYIKYENLMPIGAFKVRGGVYLASTLSEEEKRRGIIGASTGNHGQSLAYGAKLAGARCVIAMPEEGNPLKVESMRALGAEVEFHGANFEEARGWAEEEARREGLRYVHHVNSPELITGVATMSLEIMEDLPDVDVIVTPIGGGSGTVGHCLVAKGLRPEVQVIGVQAAGAPAVYNSWRERKLQRGPIHTHAEGLATGHAYYISVKTFIDRMDDMLLVSEDEIGDGVVMLARFAHQVAEDSGAAAMAGAVQVAERLRGKKVAVILSGGNMTLDGLRRVLLERAP
ncbi:MAG TPA: pyridoxal-phosphate dependent enzyme [Dehalococcoidia bacterium]|nr:pyridoxal-phosphate dependent enzyme [Dehalococcoidia bacterium]